MLTADEKKAVLDSWSAVAQDLKGHGTNLFLLFFKTHPEYQRYFRAFAEVPFDQLSGNKRLHAHGLTVMSSMATLVSSVDDVEVLDELLLKLGSNHARHKVKRGDFNNLRSVILDYMEKGLGDLWTKDTEEGWKKLLTYMMSKISEGAESKQ